ncbi:Uncharacterised protein [Mycobacterium tuberculosis]|nr:Uncharacterised protein [Mycobacterium tuberculosis]
MMSRKFAAMARMATRTWPGPNGASALGTGSRRRFLKVPALPRPNRHGPSPGGTKMASAARLPRTRAVYTCPPRSTTCGSPVANAIAIAASSVAASESTSTIRPGCSVCADPTSPHTAAPARSATSSRGSAIAPRVATTSTPDSWSVSHDCTAARAWWLRT